MTARITGSNVYGEGDPTPFVALDPPDIVIGKLDHAAPDDFVALEGVWKNRETDDEQRRTFYVKPRSVWAVAPFLEGFEDDGDA